MAKNIIYLDYNSTSPLAKSVTDYLAKGDFLYANPASAHTLGKETRKSINQSADFIKELFNLAQFNIYFHSGATEAINTFFHACTKDDVIFYSQSDHQAVTRAVQMSKASKETLQLFKDGSLDKDHLIEKLKKHQDKKCYLNYTYAHNETGVVWDLAFLTELKKIFNIDIHVDAVQSVGKIQDFQKLNPVVDMYTYSAHKFGALKGIGFSLLHPKFSLNPLLYGGGQQHELRSGTENSIGIKTIELALKDVSTWDIANTLKQRNTFEQKLRVALKDKGEIIAMDAHRLSNTTSFLLYPLTAEKALIRFDMAGLAISSGSACSVQALKESQTLKSMGYTNYLKNSLRLSADPQFYISEEAQSKILQVIDKI